MVKALGQRVDAPTQYAPEILERIVRQPRDAAIVHGFDVWHLYELSWLVAAATDAVGSSHYVGVLTIPADSVYTVESKSLKLYLNSLNFHVFPSDEEAVERIRADLEIVLGVSPELSLFAPSDITVITREPEGELLDEGALSSLSTGDSTELCAAADELEETRFISHRLRSLCPVTAQPDWATLVIDYIGPRMSRGALMAYVNSFREHQDFHERCIEAIFDYLCQQAAPQRLTVTGYFQRRGGIDITPHRSTDFVDPSLYRTGRQ
jgi:7-cyano-7-deazaguanine reductase